MGFNLVLGWGCQGHGSLVRGCPYQRNKGRSSGGSTRRGGVRQFDRSGIVFGTLSVQMNLLLGKSPNLLDPPPVFGRPSPSHVILVDRGMRGG